MTRALATFDEAGDFGVIRAEYLRVLTFDKACKSRAFRFERALDLVRWPFDASAIPQKRSESHGRQSTLVGEHEMQIGFGLFRLVEKVHSRKIRSVISCEQNQFFVDRGRTVRTIAHLIALA